MEIFIIGSGNVATALVKAILKSNHSINGIWSRNKTKGKKLARRSNCNFSNDINDIRTDSDIYLVAIKDDAVADVIRSLPKVKGIVVHTSGSVPMLNLTERNGVIYPVETISGKSNINLSKVPICIESSDPESHKIIHEFAGSLSDKVFEINSDQRSVLHLSAVFANNFTNHLFGIAKEILKREKLPVELLHPLIKTTATKAVKEDPFKIQTGPARRNDRKTIDQHMNLLSQYPEYREVYKLLSQKLTSLYQNGDLNIEDS